METTEIKVEVEDLQDLHLQGGKEEPVMTRIREDREDQPLALVKRRERDITERFPYIDEVTTTTTTTAGRSSDLADTEDQADSPDDTVTSSVDKGRLV